MSSSRRFFTKSMFRKALQCPRKLYYQNKGYPTVQQDPLEQSLAGMGQQVQHYGRIRNFARGIDMTQYSTDEALEMTRCKVRNKKNDVTLYEAPVCYGNLLARLDVLQLVANQDEIRVIEIKAKSYSGGQHDKRDPLAKRAFLPYMEDVAFQCCVVRKAFPQFNVTGWLLLPDKSKACGEVGINSKFPIDDNGQVVWDGSANDALHNEPSVMSLINVDDHVQRVLSTPIDYPGKPLGSTATLEELVDLWQTEFMQEEEPFSQDVPPIGSQCSTCEYRLDDSSTATSGFHECWAIATGLDRDDLQHPVVDLWNSLDKNLFIRNKKYVLSDLTREDLERKKKVKESDDSCGHITRSMRHVYQACGIPSQENDGGFVLKRDYLQQEMSLWRYPFHFVDFETVSPALPFFPGMAPYQTVAFQFSHHILKESGGFEHKTQFLHAEPGENPNPSFLEALAMCLGENDGTVFMYSPHEHTVLKSLLANQNDETVSSVLTPLLRGNDRALVDLKRLAEKSMFLQQAAGSNSLKKILPPLMTLSSELKRLYGQPTYGSNHVVSHNFCNMQWWQLGNDGSYCKDPYLLLSSSTVEQQPLVADGSAAMTAYQLLQWDLISPTERDELEKSLLRYCELDTLAMVMVVQAWQGWLKKEE